MIHKMQPIFLYIFRVFTLQNNFFLLNYHKYTLSSIDFITINCTINCTFIVHSEELTIRMSGTCTNVSFSRYQPVPKGLYNSGYS